MDARDIVQVFDFIIPNYCGSCFGVQFTKSKMNTIVIQPKAKEQMLILSKTRFPDVYEVTVDGVNRVLGNHIAYVPNTNLSLGLRRLFIQRNTMRLQCRFNEQRRKWTPEESFVTKLLSD